MSAEATTHLATAVVDGEGSGAMLLLDAPLSFWGGLDAGTGAIIEPAHPQHGQLIGGKVVLMERAKGSSSSSSVLAEAIRNGTGPAALVMREADLIVGLGCIVASELYGIHVPIVVVGEEAWCALLRQGRGGTLGVLASAHRSCVEVGGSQS